MNYQLTWQGGNATKSSKFQTIQKNIKIKVIE